MSRRRDADKAEAIAKGVGGLLLIVVLVGIVTNMPELLKGKNTQEALGTMFGVIRAVVFLALAVATAAVIVWWIVRHRK